MVAEHVKLAVPVPVAADPEGRVADWVAEKLVGVVPNPCEESTEAAGLARAVDGAMSVVGAVEDPAAMLPKVADWLFSIRSGGRVGFEQGPGSGDSADAGAWKKGLLVARGYRVQRGARDPVVEVSRSHGCRVQPIHSWV